MGLIPVRRASGESRVASREPRVNGPGTNDPRPGTRRWGRRLRLVGFVVLLLGIFSAVGERGLVPLYRLARTRADLEREIARLRETNAHLTEEIRSLREDPGRVEAIAREELGLVRPGEAVYDFRPARPDRRDAP